MVNCVYLFNCMVNCVYLFNCMVNCVYLFNCMVNCVYLFNCMVNCVYLFESIVYIYLTVWSIVYIYLTVWSIVYIYLTVWSIVYGQLTIVTRIDWARADEKTCFFFLTIYFSQIIFTIIQDLQNIVIFFARSKFLRVEIVTRDMLLPCCVYHIFPFQQVHPTNFFFNSFRLTLVHSLCPS